MKQLRYLWMDLRLYAIRINKGRWFWALMMPLVYPQTWAAAGIPVRVLKTGAGAGSGRSLVVYPGLRVDGDMEGR